MSHIKLSCLSSGIATELQGSASDLKNLVQMLNAQSSVRSLRNCKSKEKTHA